MYVVNILICAMIYSIPSYYFGIWSWQTIITAILVTILSAYNSLVHHNRAIDETVDSLAKHYEKQLMVEIKKAVNKAMGM